MWAYNFHIGKTWDDDNDDSDDSGDSDNNDNSDDDDDYLIRAGILRVLSRSCLYKMRQYTFVYFRVLCRLKTDGVHQEADDTSPSPKHQILDFFL